MSPELALRLGRLFRQTPAFWIELQLAHDLHAALASADVELIVSPGTNGIRPAR